MLLEPLLLDRLIASGVRLMYLDEHHYTIGVVNAKVDPSGRPEIPRKLQIEY